MACLSLAFIFFLVSLAIWQMIFVCLLFAWSSFATATAAVLQLRKRRFEKLKRNEHHFVYFDSPELPTSSEPEPDVLIRTGAPTLTIVVLMVGIYSLFLTIGFHAFRNFGNQAVGNDNLKYYVTLTICILSNGFMRLRGAAVMREHYLTRRNQPIVLTTGQCFVVLGIVLFFTAYMMWILP